MKVNMPTIKVYAKLNKNGDITAVDSSIFLRDLTGWIEIDEGYGDKYTHAQNNYFPTPIRNMDGVYMYRHISGQNIAKTPEEIQAEIGTLPKPVLVITSEQRLEALESAMLEMVLGGMA